MPDTGGSNPFVAIARQRGAYTSEDMTDDAMAVLDALGAAWHGPKLRELRKPTLVLHGGQDPLLRVSAARATAKAIDGARLVILPGAGHDLPAPLWPAIADEIRQLAGRAHAAECS
jgi:acetyl esterase/lipase